MYRSNAFVAVFDSFLFIVDCLANCLQFLRTTPNNCVTERLNLFFQRIFFITKNKLTGWGMQLRSNIDFFLELSFCIAAILINSLNVRKQNQKNLNRLSKEQTWISSIFLKKLTWLRKKKNNFASTRYRNQLIAFFYVYVRSPSAFFSLSLWNINI